MGFMEQYPQIIYIVKIIVNQPTKFEFNLWDLWSLFVGQNLK